VDAGHGAGDGAGAAARVVHLTPRRHHLRPPLACGTFRPLALQAAATSLTGLPQGEVTSRADALRVTEAIALPIDAGQWQPADNLYQTRGGNGEVWMHLPAARLGQRTATAFVATPVRRDACATTSPRTASATT